MSWSQEDLAKKLGISITHMGVVERGEGLCSVSLMLAVAKLLGLDLAAAFSDKRHGQEGAGPDVAQLFRGIPTELRPLALTVLRDFAKSDRHHPSTPTAAKPLRSAPRASKRRT